MTLSEMLTRVSRGLGYQVDRFRLHSAQLKGGLPKPKAKYVDGTFDYSEQDAEAFLRYCREREHRVRIRRAVVS